MSAKQGSSFCLKHGIERVIANSMPIEPLPPAIWNAPRGLWVANYSNGLLTAVTPDDDSNLDMIWISENPGPWREEFPDIFAHGELHWENWNNHYMTGQGLSHWSNVRSAIKTILYHELKTQNARILFSNAYLFEWPHNVADDRILDKYSYRKVAIWFEQYQGVFFTNLKDNIDVLNKKTIICLCGKYAQEAWRQWENKPTWIRNLKTIILGHPSYGHLRQSIQTQFPDSNW